ncbi:hypothetical protein WJX82_010880 [Trebouxia sp. C0006]
MATVEAPVAQAATVEDCLWMVVVAAVAAFAQSITVGASLTANCWGPALGAKAVPFKVALVLGVICQSLGVLVFGPEEYIVYGGLLDESNKLAPYPREAMYSLMWIVVTPVIWQALSIWQKTLVPAYLGTVASTAGAILVFPGGAALEFGMTSSSPPFVTGLGSILIIWACAPIISVSLTGSCYLKTRDWLFRSSEHDPMHRVLWVLPLTASAVSVICGLMMIYAIGSPRGTTAFQTTPQGTCIILAALASLASIGMCLGVPNMSRRHRSRKPIPIKRMNLLGLDETTMKDLAAEDVTTDVQGWLRWAHAHFLQVDLFKSVPASDTLMRIHSTAEEFDSTAEDFLAPFQITLGVFLSLAFGANSAHTSFGILAMMRQIQKSGTVSASASLGIRLRCISAIGTAIGTLLWGKRLAPITGVCLAKMTPFRSYIVVASVAGAVAILGTFQMKGGVITYVIVSAVAAVGLAEGTSHVNWRLLAKILLWWVAGFCLTMVATSALIAQGMYSPSLVSDRPGT